MARKSMLVVLAIMTVLVTACDKREQCEITEPTVTCKNPNAKENEADTDVYMAQIEPNQKQQENDSADLDTATKVEVSSDDTEIKIVTFSNEEIESKKATMLDTNVARGNLRYGIKPAEYGVPAGHNGTSFTFFADGSNANFAADDCPHIDIDTDDAVKIAKAYVELYDSWKWSGEPTTYDGHEVCFSWGEIKIDGVATGVKNNERILYDKAKTAYLNGQWDGTLAMLDSHYIELSEAGELLIDGYLGEGGHDNLDLPDDIDFTQANTRYVCIPPYGTFIVENKKLVNYMRLKRTEITSNPLKWESYNFDTLEYDKNQDKLYLKTFDCDENGCTCYTYVFSEYKTREKVRLLKIDN